MPTFNSSLDLSFDRRESEIRVMVDPIPANAVGEECGDEIDFWWISVDGEKASVVDCAKMRKCRTESDDLKFVMVTGELCRYCG